MPFHLRDDCLSIVFQLLVCSSDRGSFGLACYHWFNIQNTHHRSLVGLLLAPSNFTGCYPLQHLQCSSILQSHALKLLSHSLDCCFGITGNGLSLVAASCSSLEVIGVNGSGLGGFSPPSIHMDAGGRNLEPEGIIGIASGGGVEYLNVSCVKWLCKWRRSAAIGAGFPPGLKFLTFGCAGLLVTKSIAAIA
uniref:Uncharacterized protein n=1 Tax=Salix viminalis TaxID=40686 RepID=A0A6N2MBQ8_SALVM